MRSFRRFSCTSMFDHPVFTSFRSRTTC
jgi:hypothetical protein